MGGFICTTCGQYHDELPMCFGSPAPDPWYSLPERERSQRGDLTSDVCIIDEKYFFILGRILLPLVGSADHFVWLAWVSSRHNKLTPVFSSFAFVVKYCALMITPPLFQMFIGKCRFSIATEIKRQAA